MLLCWEIDLQLHVQIVYKNEKYLLLFRILPEILSVSPAKRATSCKSFMPNTRVVVYKALNIQVYTSN